MSNNIIDCQMLITALLMVISAVFGFINLEIRGKDTEGYRTARNMKAMSISTGAIAVVYMVLTVVIIHYDTNYSWIKEFPWYARLFFTVLHIVIATGMNYAATLLSMLIANRFRRLFLIKDIKKREKRIKHFNSYRLRCWSDYNKECKMIDQMIDWTIE